LFVLFRPGKDVWAYGVEPAKVHYRLRLARYPALAESVTTWLEDKSTDAQFQLLDIGAGFGRTFLYLQAADIASRFDLIGLDIAPDRKHRVYAENPWNIVQGDAEQELQFADNSFDIVVSEQLLEHLNKPEAVLASVRRILKPGGLFIVGVPIFPGPLAIYRRWQIKRHGLRGSEHIQTYSLRSIRRDLREYFDEVEVRGFRIVSGGSLRKLENYHWWYRLNRRLGTLVPSLCIEVQFLLKLKQDSV